MRLLSRHVTNAIRPVNGSWICASCRRASSTARRKALLPESPARTRFAPSPTGQLHIGGLRTALFSFLLAKRTRGQFLLRIEDTDQKRLVPGAEDRLCEDLRWAGLQWDEGPQMGGPYGPYKQSERNDIYHRHAEGLLASRAAYRCYCTPGQATQAYVTSGCSGGCSALPTDISTQRAGSESFTVRLHRPESSKKRTYPDLIYGNIIPLKRSATAVATGESDAGLDVADTILIKSDRTPTYHFANAVDDHLMKITHVIRGSEWMASTPLHYDLYHAFGWEPPVFAHVGLLVDQNKAKLSKRNEDLALDVRSMKEELGVLPQALVNYLALLGWSNPTNDDVMDMAQLIGNFDLKFTKGNAMVRMEKLWFLQKKHVSRLCDEARSQNPSLDFENLVDSIEDEVLIQYPQRFPASELRGFCKDILLADSKGYQNPRQFIHRLRYLFNYDPAQVPDGEDADISPQDLQIVLDALIETPAFKSAFAGDKSDGESSDLWWERASATIHDIVVETAMAHMPPDEVSLEDHERAIQQWKKAVMTRLREKLSYGLPGPTVSTTMALLGYEECCSRLATRPSQAS